MQTLVLDESPHVKNADGAGRALRRGAEERVGDFRSNGCKNTRSIRAGAASRRRASSSSQRPCEGARRPVPARSAVREVVVVIAARSLPFRLNHLRLCATTAPAPSTARSADAASSAFGNASRDGSATKVTSAVSRNAAPRRARAFSCQRQNA